jgi:hypothetical protein
MLKGAQVQLVAVSTLDMIFAQVLQHPSTNHATYSDALKLRSKGINAVAGIVADWPWQLHWL